MAALAQSDGARARQSKTPGGKRQAAKIREPAEKPCCDSSCLNVTIELRPRALHRVSVKCSRLAKTKKAGLEIQLKPHTERQQLMHLPSHRGQRGKLVTAMTVLAFLAIIAIALYALSLIACAVVTTAPPTLSGNHRCLSADSRCRGGRYVYRDLRPHPAVNLDRAVDPIS